jgi:hypothetical protein
VADEETEAKPERERQARIKFGRAKMLIREI